MNKLPPSTHDTSFPYIAARTHKRAVFIATLLTHKLVFVKKSSQVRHGIKCAHRSVVCSLVKNTIATWLFTSGLCRLAQLPKLRALCYFRGLELPFSKLQLCLPQTWWCVVCDGSSFYQSAPTSIMQTSHQKGKRELLTIPIVHSSFETK